MNKTVSDFAKWLGLVPGKKYNINNKPLEVFTFDKYYNLYYLGDNIGISLSSLTLHDLLNIKETNMISASTEDVTIIPL